VSGERPMATTAEEQAAPWLGRRRLAGMGTFTT
jgi:hypothetical protein